LAIVWVLAACLLSAAGAVKAELITAQSTTGATEENEALIQEAAPELQRPSVWGMPTTVDVALYVIDVDALNSAEQNFSASVFYAASWEIPVMRHEGPGPLIRRITDVWTPRLTIVNQQQAWSAFPPYVEVSPDGYVTLRQKVWGHFSQPLDLRDFPLDRQTLAVHLVAAGLLETEVRMVPFSGEHGRSSGISPNFSIPDFDIVSWTAESRPLYPFEGEVGTAGFILEIELNRRPEYYFWKVIFPICLIIIMSWAPRWVRPTQIGANVGIATTAFLTLIAYLFAIQNVLPPVSYLTRMDKFILLSIIMVFIGLLHTVVIATLVKKEVTKPIQRSERLSRAIYPLALIGVLYVAFKLP
jgi:hypothetical protein